MTTAVRRWAVVASALLLAACGAGGDPVDPVTVPREGPLPAKALGACLNPRDEQVHSDYRAPLSDTFLKPGFWLRVEEVDAADARKGVERRFPGRYVLAGGDDAFVRTQPAVRGEWSLTGERAKAAEAALAGGAQVYVWTHSGDDGGGIAVALRGTDYAFLGDCAYQRQTSRLGLGRSGGAYLAAMAGKSSAEMRRLLGWPAAGPAGGFGDEVRRTLAPGVTPPEVLRGLRRSQLVVRVPASWRGDALVCPSTYLGDGPCVDLRRPAPVTFYFDDEHELRFYVRARDDAGHGRPIGDVEPERLARRQRVRLRDGVGITVVLNDAVPVGEVLRRGWPRGEKPIESVLLEQP